jgi:hypothetical protein
MVERRKSKKEFRLSCSRRRGYSGMGKGQHPGNALLSQVCGSKVVGFSAKF